MWHNLRYKQDLDNLAYEKKKKDEGKKDGKQQFKSIIL